MTIRSFIVCFLVIVALLLIGVRIYHRVPPQPLPPPAQSVPVVASSSITTGSDAPSTSSPSIPPERLPYSKAPLLMGAAALAAIDNASTQYDPDAVPIIVPYLYSSDKSLRAAALDGLLRLGESDSAPYLREAAKQAPTQEEADTWRKAADYLALPSGSIHSSKHAQASVMLSP